MERAVPPLLALFGAAQLVLGVLLWAAPGTFFDEIGPYGTRNDHYMADVATFYLALGAAALVAVVRSSWRVPVLAVALLQYVLHSVNHLIDVGEADPAWLGPANLVALAATAALLGWMLRVASRRA
jgi:presenilin-like A22 family membrane protease